MEARQLPLVGGHSQGFGATVRNDNWWIGPVVTVSVLSSFIVYATWAALQGNYYYADPYLSPFYSPVLFTNPSMPGAAPLHHSWFGMWPFWWPSLLPASPAFLILPFPGAFRFTCYYYRKAYYRSFGGSPPACAVGANPKPNRSYRGETGLLIFQNLHRYALYFAVLFVGILGYDAVLGFFRGGKFGIGVGSLVLSINVIFISGYTFGCHSFRHLIGGRSDCLSCDGKPTAKLNVWKGSSWLNARHMQFAWLSLFWVAFSDVYVRLVAMGVIYDWNTWS